MPEGQNFSSHRAADGRAKLRFSEAAAYYNGVRQGISDLPVSYEEAAGISCRDRS